MLTQEQKETMIAALRGKSVAKENITEEYKKNLDLAEREAVKVTTSEGPVPCYIFKAKNRTENCRVHINVHGGGFVRPHVLRDEIYSAKVADAIQGIVVDVDYSLAPEYPYREHSTRPTRSADGYSLCWITGMPTESAFPWADTVQAQI